MSAIPVIYLYCDGEKCPRDDGDSPQSPYSIDPTIYRNISEQRAEAKKAGWTRRRGKDYCPECVVVPVPSTGTSL